MSCFLEYKVPYTKITNYDQNNKANWACSGCKQSKPKSTQVTQVIQDTQEPLITTKITVNSDDTTSNYTYNC